MFQKTNKHNKHGEQYKNSKLLYCSELYIHILTK